MFILSLLVFGVNPRSQAAAASEQKGFTFYLAAGPNFVVPTSLRVGWNQWEFGLLTQNFVGFNKTFLIPGKVHYAGFALGANTDPFQTGVGFQSAVGVRYQMFWGLSFRAEMLANANTNGSTMAHGLAGVSYGF